jgi:hypothetical protein
MARRRCCVLAIAAFLFGCGVQQQQYQAADSASQPDECATLRAVSEDRERYGIPVPSGDEDALRHCGLPYGGHKSLQVEPVQTTFGAEEIPIRRSGGEYLVPVRINQTITLPFILDTGATVLTIPADVALTLIRRNFLLADPARG